ncbi:hypothetical protein PgNI_11105 [Pyricularia grisea]|uniref:Uncharacterized protein n=1 Tax=Pyricularia grisea TaxID=148305 RepID=A0A6P8AYN3_PYRGI|nr:hypothetical protein PgNI_11105 [Pyricularia grisea]TLD07468.1 hypothetical protein PgNI_11105 [Pyricularia grisea]
MAPTRAGFMETTGLGGRRRRRVRAFMSAAEDQTGDSPWRLRGVNCGQRRLEDAVAQNSRREDDELSWIEQNYQTEQEKEERRADAIARQKGAETSASCFYYDLDVASLHGTPTVSGELDKTTVFAKAVDAPRPLCW